MSYPIRLLWEWSSLSLSLWYVLIGSSWLVRVSSCVCNMRYHWSVHSRQFRVCQCYTFIVLSGWGFNKFFRYNSPCKKTNLTTFVAKAKLFSLYKRNVSAEKAKVSNMELTLMFHGAPQVILVFSPKMACRAGCRVQRFLDIQPSWRVFMEFDVAEKDKFMSKG